MAAPTSTKPLRAAKYRRISNDAEGRELGVTRQDEDLDAFADKQGYAVVANYCDNDLSAGPRSTKPRPDYDRMLADAKSGDFEVIIAYTSSRLTRRPLEHEAQIQLAEAFGIRYDFIRSPSFDLNTAQGRLVARILADTDTAWSEITSENVTRARLQQAENGRFGGGGRRFGFEPDGVTVRAPEATEIVKAADAVLAGMSLYGLVTDLRARGVSTVSGKPWTSSTLRDILLRPRNAGLMVYQGQVVEGVQAPWEPIIPREQWEAVRAILTAKDRRTSPGNQPRWLGSCIYLCGHPDHSDDDRPTMRVGTSGATRGRPGYLAYRCRGDRPGHITRAAEPLDAAITELLLARLEEPKAAKLLRPQRKVNVKALVREAGAIRGRISEAIDLWESGDLPKVELQVRKRRLEAQLTEIQARLDSASERDPLAGLAGNPLIREIWDKEPSEGGLSIERKRAVLDSLLTVTVLPARKGRPAGWAVGDQYFDTGTIRPEWKR